jgi:putative ABC transport system ATP-binding protein
MDSSAMRLKDPPSDILIVNKDKVLFKSGVGKLTRRPNISATLVYYLTLFSQKIMKGEQHHFIRFDNHRMIFLPSQKPEFPALASVVLTPLDISPNRVIPTMKMVLALVEDFLEGSIKDTNIAHLDCFNRVINFPSQSIFLLPKTTEGIRSALVLLAGFAYDLNADIELIPSRMIFVMEHDYLSIEKIIDIPNLGVFLFLPLPAYLLNPPNKFCEIGEKTSHRTFFSAIGEEKSFQTLGRIFGPNSYAHKVSKLIDTNEAVEIAESIADLDKIYDVYVRNDILFATILNPGKDILATLSRHLLIKMKEIAKMKDIDIQKADPLGKEVIDVTTNVPLDKIDGFVRLANVERVYKMGDQEIRALKNITLNLASGQLVVVLGPSGSGKTTLLNVIGGIDRCKGTIQVGDVEITKLSKGKLAQYRRTSCGFIFQFFNLLPVFNAQENVEYAVELIGKKTPKEVTHNALKYLKAVGMYDKKNQFPSQLSGGEQQRIAAARAFAKEPKILLCDEPTGELSVKEGKKVLAVIQRLVQNNPDILALLVTHNQKIAQIGNLVIRLRSGEVDNITRQIPVDAETISW